MSKPTVFISYSHQDEKWKNRLVKQLKVLQLEGRFQVWDDRHIAVGSDWLPEIEAALNAAAAAVLLISADFLTSNFIRTNEVPLLLQRRRDAGVLVAPLILKPCPWDKVNWLSKTQARPTDGKALSTMRKPQADAALAALASEIADLLSESRTGFQKTPEDRISPSHLPVVGELLVGREQELKLLDQAWEDPKKHVLSIVAFGGVGKTALVKHWLGRMAADNYRGAERVFEWSFHSQGTSEDRAASADQFIDKALRFFGDPSPEQGSPDEKGARLAGLVAQSRTLLVLDGLEPLQYPPGPKEGRIKIPALRTLIEGLARRNPGLCVVTTREAVAEIGFLRDTTAPRLELEFLSDEAGAALLAKLGVKGESGKLSKASADFGGHALALTLLGTFLRDRFGGNIAKRGQVKLLRGATKDVHHAVRVMQSYEQWFAEEGDEAALALLRLMGFFDRPAEAGALEVLMAEPAIEGLTEALAGMYEDDYIPAVSRLRDARLATPSFTANGSLESVESHPLIREYFAKQLEERHKEPWREGHRRLYEHLKQSAKHLPDTLEEMMPLYQAVAHGCRAGLHQETLDEVYWARVLRCEHFTWQKLGACGADLAAISNFFERTWNRPSTNLTPQDQSWLLSMAGFHLRSQGRLSEATEPMRAALEAGIQREDWGNSARRASNLSELRLTLGDLPQAVEDARRSVELADRSGEAEEKMVNRTILADALHQSGDLAQARSLFREAERMQKELQPQYPLSCGLAGFRYCDLLLGKCESPAWHRQASLAPSRSQALSRCRQVRRRAAKTLEWAEQQQVSLLSIALDHLTLGRTFLLEAALNAPSSPIPAPQRQPPASSLQTEALSQCRRHLDRAVAGLRQAGQQDDMPRGLIARAQLRRFLGHHDQARQDLAEASQIAARGPMPLFQADIHLEHSRLHHAKGDDDQARQSLAEARRLVGKHGYHRREAELEAMEEAFLRNRYHELVDLKHLGQLTQDQEGDLKRIARQLDKIEEPFYRPILAELEKRLADNNETDD